MSSGGDLLDDHATPGYSISTTDHWQASDSSGELPKIVDIVGRHYGPPLLIRYNNDDDELESVVSYTEKIEKTLLYCFLWRRMKRKEGSLTWISRCCCHSRRLVTGVLGRKDLSALFQNSATLLVSSAVWTHPLTNLEISTNEVMQATQ